MLESLPARGVPADLMSELQEQLAALRARMARVLEDCAEKYEGPLSRKRIEGLVDEAAAADVLHADDFSMENAPGTAQYTARGPVVPRVSSVHSLPPGEEIETDQGKHYETETFYPSHQRHGSADVGALCELPADLLQAISGGTLCDVPVNQWVFLDTETTGLAGGTGTCAFLVGAGRITPDGFRVRQFFMRDFAEEASLLHGLAQHLEQFRVVITYNGRTFDQPLLETRYRMNRRRPPFAKMEHLDLLYGARRLWKLRYESCRLVELEQRVLGFERYGDIPGALIPAMYFEYLQSGEMGRLGPVFYHNALDILTLACLTGIVPYAFRNPSQAPFRHGAEMAGMARWLHQAGELPQARDLFRRAVEAGLPDALLFRTLWDIAALEKKLGSADAARDVWNDLAGSRNGYQARALEELAKHHEHGLKDYALALEMTERALKVGRSDGLLKRRERLKKRLADSDKHHE